MKKNIIGFFIVVILLMCVSCNKRLPENTKNTNDFTKVYELFLLLEENKISEAEVKLSKLSYLDIENIGKGLICLYQNTSCEVTFDKKDDEVSKLAQIIQKIIKRDTSGLYQLKSEIDPFLIQQDQSYILDYYCTNLLIKEQYHRKLDFHHKVVSNDLRKDLKFFLELNLHAKNTFRYGDEDTAKSLYTLICNLDKSFDLLKLYPHLFLGIYKDIYNFFLAIGKDNSIVNIQKSISKLNIDIPTGLWQLEIENKLTFLLATVETQSLDQIIKYTENEILNHEALFDEEFKSKTYLDLAYIVDEGEAPIHITKSFLKKSIESDHKSKCASNLISATHYLVELLMDEGNHIEAKSYLDKISNCENLKNNLEYALLAAKGNYKAYFCFEKSDLNSCKEGLDIIKLQDANFEKAYSKEKFHLSAYYASSAPLRFKYFKKIEELKEDSLVTEKAFRHLQNTKYRIFNYKNNYNKIYARSVIRQLDKIEESINELELKLSKIEEFQGETKGYIHLVQLNLDKYDLLETSENQGPENKSEEEKISIAAIQQKLKTTNSQMVEYYQYRQNLRVFVINPDTFYHETIALDSLLASSVNLLKEHQRIQIIDSIDLESSSKYVYKTLLKNHIKSAYPNLVMIPDGILNGISFETLMDSKGEMLMENYNFSYAYGINNVNSWTDESELLTDLCLLSYSSANTITDRSIKDYPELPGGSEEVRYASSIFEGEKIKVFQGEKCTMENLERSLSYDIAHIATHAFSDPKHRNGNYFITRTSTQTEKTYGYELENVKASSKLAVLSACETGIGKYELGEGVFSLSRNLQQAGVPSVIKTLWQVDDTFSATLMQFFYSHLSEGETVAVALNRAKKDLIISENVKDPYYWSGYVLEGNPFLSFHTDQ